MTPKHITMYARPECEDSDAAREFLRRLRLPFEERNIEEDPEARRFVAGVNEGKERTPTFKVDCRVFPCSPFDPQTLARHLGLPQEGALHSSQPKSAAGQSGSTAMPTPEGPGRACPWQS